MHQQRSVGGHTEHVQAVQQRLKELLTIYHIRCKNHIWRPPLLWELQDLCDAPRELPSSGCPASFINGLLVEPYVLPDQVLQICTRGLFCLIMACCLVRRANSSIWVWRQEHHGSAALWCWARLLELGLNVPVPEGSAFWCNPPSAMPSHHQHENPVTFVPGSLD